MSLNVSKFKQKYKDITGVAGNEGHTEKYTAYTTVVGVSYALNPNGAAYFDIISYKEFKSKYGTFRKYLSQRWFFAYQAKQPAVVQALLSKGIKTFEHDEHLIDALNAGIVTPEQL